MKILILLKKYEGGVGVVIKNIKKELEKKGHEIKIISRQNDLSINSFSLSVSKLRKFIIKEDKKNNYDIIYTQDWSMAVPLLFPFRIFKKKHFVCFHGNQLGKTKFMQKIIGKKMGKRLFVVGDSLKQNFPKANLIYNGVDLDKFKPLNKKRDCLGWINKDTEILTKEEVLEISKKLKLKPLIAENFEIPFDKMNENFYNRCQVFVSLPPITAGFNLCWIEAMSAGVPVIVGNNEGIGWKLNIDKFKTKKEFFNSFKKIKANKYRKEIEKSDLTWENHVGKLLEIWKK